MTRTSQRACVMLSLTSTTSHLEETGERDLPEPRPGRLDPPNIVFSFLSVLLFRSFSIALFNITHGTVPPRIIRYLYVTRWASFGINTVQIEAETLRSDGG